MAEPISRVQLFRVMVDNQEKFGNPMGISSKRMVEWADDIPFTSSSSSSTYIYTGGLYQMMPKAERFVELMKRAEESSGLSFALRFLGGSAASTLASKLIGVDHDKFERSKAIIRNASRLLRKSGIEHSYLGRDEPYTGILFYELGMEEYFIDVARKAAKLFREKGVKKLITIDPHSTYALRELYPDFLDSFDVEVLHYLEVAKPSRNDTWKGKATVHDPCILSRRLKLSSNYREFLEALGIEYTEPARSGRMTFCCGGPIESIAPAVSTKISELRCSQLAEKGDKAVVACPICLSNLGRCGYSRDRGGSNARIEVFDALELVHVG
ncbi:MAG: (Fe-S)-binding protein [Conexivisphaerales archaeon]